MKTISVSIRNILFILLAVSFASLAQDVEITGVVTDHKDSPVQDVTIALKSNSAISTKTDVDGKYSLVGNLPITNPFNNNLYNSFLLRGNKLTFTLLKKRQRVSVTLYSVKGRKYKTVVNDIIKKGTYTFNLFDRKLSSSVYFILVDVDGHTGAIKVMYVKGHPLGTRTFSSLSGKYTGTHDATGLFKSAAFDTLLVSKAAYESRSRSIDQYTGIQDFIIVPSDLSASSVKYPLSSSTTLNYSHTSVNRYGVRPQISVIGNSDNSCDVALYVSSTNKIQVLSFDSAGIKTNDITPAYITGAEGLLGLTKITGDGSFVVGFSKDNSFGDNAFEFWITRFSSTGTEAFTKSIFGSISADVVESEGQPGNAGSGRIVYNPATQRIGFYCAHTRLWDDMVRHQGGHIGFMDLQGEFYTANSWFFSHNFDQRLIVVDSFYFALAHGDAYPRKLGFSKWDDIPPNGHRLINKNYLDIPGSVGDNNTNAQTGSMIRLKDGTFGVVFTTKIGRDNWDVCYTNINASGEPQDTLWLTSYPQETFAIFSKIASYGKCMLIAWEEVTDRVPKVKTFVLDTAGVVISYKRELDGAELSPFYDLVTVPNGDILWATLADSDNIELWRIKK
jgi:hypothetical protein